MRCAPGSTTRSINDFISKNPGCTVVNLGCGFDTRYWRIDHSLCKYIELDLPEIIELKKDALQGRLSYELIPCSVLDTAWIDRVTSQGNRNFLLAAEGLLMYLPQAEVINLFKTLSEKFYRSQIVLRWSPKNTPMAFGRRLLSLKRNASLGSTPDQHTPSASGAAELETYGKGIKVIDEWSYVEDPDVRPRIYKYMGLNRTQWTVTAAINENG